MKTRIFALAVAALLLAAFAASAQTGTWTAVGSTGTVDPAQVSQFAVTAGTHLGFSSSATLNTITARFNVTNTYGGGVSDILPWTTLDLGAVSTTTTSPVTATLYRVDRCTGARTLICRVSSTTAPSTGACVTCTFSPDTINFSSNGGELYYVEVTLTRGSTSPQLTTLRIF